MPSNYTATYKKDGGFIYTPYTIANTSNNRIKKGNIELYYQDGKANGFVYDTNIKNNPIFTISGEENNLIITSTQYISNSGTTISENQKASMTVDLINSKKGESDYRYIIGTTRSDPGGNNEVGFSALLFAEKQNSQSNLKKQK